MGAWRFDWHYTAAGLGWGIAVGMLTGGVLAFAVAVAVLGQDISGFSGAMFLLTAPLLGAVYGIVPGSVVGLAAGLTTSVITGGIRDRRRAWWTAFATTAAAGLAVGLAVAFLLDPSPAPGPAALVMGVPVLLGAYLMARTSRSVIEAAERRAVERPEPVAT